MQFNVFRKWEFSWFVFPSHFWILDFRFPFFFFFKPGEGNVKNLTSENRRKIIRWTSKIRNQNCLGKKVIENSRQYLSEQIFYRKQSFGAFVLWHLACTLTTRIQSSGICWNSHRLHADSIKRGISTPIFWKLITHPAYEWIKPSHKKYFYSHSIIFFQYFSQRNSQW